MKLPILLITAACASAEKPSDSSKPGGQLKNRDLASHASLHAKALKSSKSKRSKSAKALKSSKSKRSKSAKYPKSGVSLQLRTA